MRVNMCIPMTRKVFATGENPLTLDANLIISWCLSNFESDLLVNYLVQVFGRKRSQKQVSIGDIYIMLERIVTNENFKQFISFAKPEKFVESLVELCIPALKECPKDELDSMLKLSKELLQLVFTCYPLEKNWIGIALSINNAITEHLFYQEHLYQLSYVVMLSRMDFESATEYFDNQHKIAVSALTNLMCGTTALSYSHFLIRLGLNRGYFQEKYGDDYSIFCGYLKFRLNEEFGFKILQLEVDQFFGAVNDQIRVITEQLGICKSKFYENLLSMFKDIATSSYEGRRSDDPDDELHDIFITSPRHFELWRHLLQTYIAECKPCDDTRSQFIFDYVNALTNPKLLDPEDMPFPKGCLLPPYLLMTFDLFPSDSVEVDQVIEIYKQSPDPNQWYDKAISIFSSIRAKVFDS
jgi:hypothetical protein